MTAITSLRPTSAPASHASPPPFLRWPMRGLQLSIISLGCGFQVATGFSVGNILQLIAFVLLIPAWPLLRRDMFLLLPIIAGITISVVPLVILLDVSPEWPQVPYFVLCTVHLFLAIRIAPYFDPRTLLRTPVNLVALLIAATAIEQLARGNGGVVTLYFDDKSHTAVAVTCVAFLLLWVNTTFWRLPFAVVIIFVAVATGSRLVIFAAPFFLAALFDSYRRSRVQAPNPVMVYMHHLTLLAVPALAIALYNSPLATFLQARLSQSSQAGAVASNSTLAHLELARMASDLKLHDSLVMIFGVGPGGFAAGIRGLGIDASAFGHLDPYGYTNLMSGASFVPIHSVNLSILVEFPIWVSAAFFLLWWRIIVHLWRKRDITMLCMAGSLFSMTTFYSAHNEYFYTAALSALCLAALGRTPQQRGETTVG